MQLFSAIAVDEVGDLTKFTFSKGPRLHLMLPLIFFALALTLIFGWEYYREWKRKRRMRRYWAVKSSRPQK
jgi:hypothetical protein